MSQEGRGDLRVPHGVAPFDLNSLLRRLGDDRAAAAAVLRAFARDAPLQLLRLRDAVEKGETAQVKFLAHTLKGSLLWIGAADAAAAASMLEQSASSESGGSAREGLAELSTWVELILVAIASRPDA